MNEIPSTNRLSDARARVGALQDRILVVLLWLIITLAVTSGSATDGLLDANKSSHAQPLVLVLCLRRSSVSPVASKTQRTGGS